LAFDASDGDDSETSGPVARVAEQRRLADAGLADDEQSRPGALASFREERIERILLALATPKHRDRDRTPAGPINRWMRRRRVPVILARSQPSTDMSRRPRLIRSRRQSPGYGLSPRSAGWLSPERSHDSQRAARRSTTTWSWRTPGCSPRTVSSKRVLT